MSGVVASPEGLEEAFRRGVLEGRRRERDEHRLHPEYACVHYAAAVVSGRLLLPERSEEVSGWWRVSV